MLDFASLDGSCHFFKRPFRFRLLCFFVALDGSVEFW